MEKKKMFVSLVHRGHKYKYWTQMRESATQECGSRVRDLVVPGKRLQ